MVEFEQMGGGGEKPAPVPDWRAYNVDKTVELRRIKKNLAAYGIKDNWLRYIFYGKYLQCLIRNDETIS